MHFACTHSTYFRLVYVYVCFHGFAPYGCIRRRVRARLLLYNISVLYPLSCYRVALGSIAVDF